MKHTRPLFLIALAGLVALGGCTVGPDYEEPELPNVPDAWHTAVTEGVLEGDAPIQTWWSVFDDETLTSLIEPTIMVLSSASSVQPRQCWRWCGISIVLLPHR